MGPMLARVALSAVAAIAYVVAAGATPAGAAPFHLVYDAAAPAKVLFTGSGALTPERGGFRQIPSSGGVFREDARHQLVQKVSADELVGLSADEMASMMRRSIDESPGRLIAIDEIGNAFRDPRSEIRTRFVVVRGTRIRVRGNNTVRVTRGGYRIIRRVTPPTFPPSASPGATFSRAMQRLAALQSPIPGQSYAERIHLYLAPAFVTSVALGRGPHFTQDRTGMLPIRAGWQGVMPGLARAGGVWLQMYHGTGNAVSLTVYQRAPKRFVAYLRRFGGSIRQAHMVISGSPVPPRGSARACGGITPMSCQWSLASSTGMGRLVLRNGVGAYRVGDQAAQWLEELNLRGL